jgi:hypothetical protein
MSANNPEQVPDIELDREGLYREETFSDRRAGSVVRLSPVKPDGSPDHGREVLYLGQTQIMTPVGTLPLSFQLDATTLDQAIAQFPQAAKVAVERTVEELKELRREAASSIVIPPGGAGGVTGLGGPGGMPGGAPGGGRILRR